LIDEIQDERLVLMKMLGVRFRVYLQCDTCRAVFMSKTDLPPADELLFCPRCSSACLGISYRRAVGILQEEYVSSTPLEWGPVGQP